MCVWKTGPRESVGQNIISESTRPAALANAWGQWDAMATIRLSYCRTDAFLIARIHQCAPLAHACTDFAMHAPAFWMTMRYTWGLRSRIRAHHFFLLPYLPGLCLFNAVVSTKQDRHRTHRIYRQRAPTFSVLIIVFLNESKNTEREKKMRRAEGWGGKLVKMGIPGWLQYVYLWGCSVFVFNPLNYDAVIYLSLQHAAKFIDNNTYTYMQVHYVLKYRI